MHIGKEFFSEASFVSNRFNLEVSNERLGANLDAVSELTGGVPVFLSGKIQFQLSAIHHGVITGQLLIHFVVK